MKPYPVLTSTNRSREQLLKCLLGILLVTTFFSGAERAAAAASLPAGPYRADQDPQVKQALDDFYNLEYDKALSLFDHIEKAHPDDPFAIAHILQATVFRELYRLNLLDTTLYAHDGFLSGRAANGDPAIRKRVDDLTAQAVKLCDDRLAKNPNDVDALYVRGVVRGLKSTYMALVDKSFVAALTKRGRCPARSRASSPDRPEIYRCQNGGRGSQLRGRQFAYAGKGSGRNRRSGRE